MSLSTHEPTEKSKVLVAALSANGCSQQAILFSLTVFLKVNINTKTLRKHYKKELDAKNEFFKGAIMGSMARAIMNGDTRMTIFAAKTILGLRETVNLDLNNPIPNFDLLSTDPTGEIIEAEYAEIAERPLLG